MLPIRILNVISTIDPVSGGPAEYVRQIGPALKTLGHEVDVLSFDNPSQTFVKEFPIRVYALDKIFGPFGFSPPALRWLIRESMKYDVIVVHGLWRFSLIAAWLGSRSGRRPLLVFVHGMMDPWFRRANPFKHVLKQIYWTLIQGRILGSAAGVLFTTEDEKELAAAVFAGPRYHAEIVRMGIEDVPHSSPNQIESFRHLLPALGARRYLLFLGRIHPKKGCDILIDAFASIASDYNDLDLVFAGPDQTGWQAALKARAERFGISARVHWAGMVSGDRKWGAYRGATAFVLPSHQENFGIVVAEALACETPVVISNAVNIWREVASSGSGLICDPSISSCSEALARLLEMSDDGRISMGVLGRAAFLRYFEIGEATKSFEQTLRRSLESETT